MFATTRRASRSTSGPSLRSATRCSWTSAWPAGSAGTASPSSGSARAESLSAACTSRSSPPTVRAWTPSTRGRWPQAPPTTARPARARCTTSTTTARTCSTSTATTSKPCATRRNNLAVPWDVLSDEQLEIRDLVRTLARDRIAPRAAEIDESHEFPWDVVELYREHEIFGLFFDDAYGGTGTGTLLSLVAIEEVSKVCATSGLILAVQELGSLGLKIAGSDEQKARFLSSLASGETLAAYALTEAGSGSDSASMRTTARRDGEAYVLDGSKRFITNAAVAGLYTVFAKTDPDAGHSGISAFVVEAGTPGFEVARLEPKMGIAGSTTGELTFDDVRVPAGN